MSIVTASKYGDARDQARAVQTSGPTPAAVKTPAIFVPTQKDNKYLFLDWFWRELKYGGKLHAYLEREKATSARRMRAVARQCHGVKANAKSDFQLKAVVPAREFYRWKKTDPDFWRDDRNLKSLRRDNPDAVVLV